MMRVGLAEITLAGRLAQVRGGAAITKASTTGSRCNGQDEGNENLRKVMTRNSQRRGGI